MSKRESLLDYLFEKLVTSADSAVMERRNTFSMYWIFFALLVVQCYKSSLHVVEAVTVGNSSPNFIYRNQYLSVVCWKF